MNVSINQARRPMAMFDYSEDGKHVIAKIMQHGDKFGVTEKIADEWLAHIEKEAAMGRYDASWVAQFKAEHAAFLKGNDLPREGTPILTWAAITREQIKRLISLNITTVEDLAAFPDSGLGTIGLDGRTLRDLARNVVDAKTHGVGEIEKKLADAEQRERDLKATVERMDARMKELEAALPKKKAA
jgi:hypothetical protein